MFGSVLVKFVPIDTDREARSDLLTLLKIGSHRCVETYGFWVRHDQHAIVDPGGLVHSVIPQHLTESLANQIHPQEHPE